MIIYTTPTIPGTRMPSEPVMAYAHAAKPWQGLVALGGFRIGDNRVDDNCTRVSAIRRRHE
ncbi:MAG: hypothetical protein ACT4RN_17970 [Pseudonocardia sp.]